MERLTALLDAVEAHSRTRKCMRRATVAMAYAGDMMVTGRNGPLGSHVCTGIQGGCGCSHAEQGVVLALLSLNMMHRVDVEIWSYLSPCPTCANLIVLTAMTQVLRVQRFVYVEEYEEHMGKRILIEGGIDVVKADR